MRYKLENYINILCTLQYNTLDNLDKVVAKDIVFADPFNETKNRDQLKIIFSHMYQKLNNVRFEVFQVAYTDNISFITWRFSANSKITGDFSFEGCSEIKLNDDGLVIYHRDYWDASELMVALPLVGKLIKSLRKRMSTDVH
jgi:hypothetical protein